MLRGIFVALFTWMPPPPRQRYCFVVFAVAIYAAVSAREFERFFN
jgi:hypothetical protein